MRERNVEVVIRRVNGAKEVFNIALTDDGILQLPENVAIRKGDIVVVSYDFAKE